MNSTWLITSELANQRARKVLFTCVVYTKFGYSSVSEVQSPTLATRLPGFCPGVYRDRKVITLCEFEFSLNCKQHVTFHQGTNTSSLNTPQFCLGEKPINRWLTMKRSARRCVFCNWLMFENILKVYGWKYRKTAEIISKEKSNHRSKFSNLCKWEEEAWKSQGWFFSGFFFPIA